MIVRALVRAGTLCVCMYLSVSVCVDLCVFYVFVCLFVFVLVCLFILHDFVCICLYIYERVSKARPETMDDK